MTEKAKNLSSGLEDYVEAIYIAHLNNKPLKGAELARQLNISRASVSEALAKLVAKNLIKYNSYEAISITKEGIEEAKKVILIAIIDYPLELTQTISEMETVWKLCEKNHPNLVLTDSIEICILELDKVKNTYYKNKHDKKAQ